MVLSLNVVLLGGVAASDFSGGVADVGYASARM
jgi:hypothetical protein